MARRRFDLEGRTVLLTGGSSGVGAALLARLLDAGVARVVIWSRSAPAITDEAVIHEAVDLADMAAIDAALDGLFTRHPALSVVVNNAGVAERARFDRDAPDDLDRLAETQIAVNLRAPIRIAQRVFPALAARDDAMIVMNTSGLAVAPTVKQPIYSATKAGLRSFTISLRYQAERAAPRLRVVEVLLPLVDTPMTASFPMRKLSADKAAARIMAGLERGEAEIWVGAAAVLKRIVSASPGLARLILKKATG